jgi:hypothetical protein
MTYFSSPAASATFRPDKFAKTDLVRGDRLFLGLNCFEPASVKQPTPTEGRTNSIWSSRERREMTVGTETEVVEAGRMIWAPADIPHGVDEALERTVLLVGMAPPPR